MNRIAGNADSARRTLIFGLILVLGGFLMFGGAGWGLPTILHPDERTIVEPAIRMVQNRSFLPDVFYRPDHLLIHINALIYRVIVFLKGLPAESIGEIGIWVFHLTARIVTGVFAMGSIVMAYLIGKRYSNNIGLISAFLFAVFPLFVTHAHYASSDVPTTFFMLLFVFTALVYMQKPTFKNVVLLSLITAAFITVKYTGAILLLMIAVSVIVVSVVDKKYIRILKHGIAAAFFSVLFVFLISPILFIRFNDVKTAFLNEARPEHLGSDGLGMGGNMLFYMNTYMTAGGIILLVFFGFGCYALLSDRKNLYKHLPLFYSFIYWICLSYVPLHWERWALPMYVSPLIISAIGVNKVCELIRASKISPGRQKLFYKVFIVVLCLSALNLLTSAFGNLLDHRIPDTRVVSQAYVIENGMDENNTVFEGYTPLKPGKGGFAFAAFEKADGNIYLVDENIEHIILSSDMFDRILYAPDKFPGEVMFYRLLAENFTETKRFNVASRNKSPIDVVNIVYSIGYMARVIENGQTGPTLIFYETSAQNYINPKT